MLIILIIILILILADFLAAYIMIRLSLDPRHDVHEMFESSGLIFNNNRPDNIANEHTPEHVYIKSHDGLKLHALMVKSEQPDEHRWLIGVHGYMADCEEMCWRNGEFYRMGFNVIFPDLRGHGESEGKYVGMGWHDRLDVMSWIDHIIKMDSDAEIVLFGVSMGGATVMMASGEDLPENVKAIVEDCGYTSVKDILTYQAKQMYHVPYWPLVATASLISKFKNGYSFDEGSSVEQVRRSKTPTIFIHGSSDDFVPFSMLDKVYEAASCEKEKLVIEGAEHARAMDTDPKLYWGTIKEFLGRYGLVK